MTRAELAAVLAAATAGPWRVYHRCSGCDEMDDESCGLGLEIVGPEEPQLRGQFSRSADARLIAAARNVLPELLRRLDLAETALADVAFGHASEMNNACGEGWLCATCYDTAPCPHQRARIALLEIRRPFDTPDAPQTPPESS